MTKEQGYIYVFSNDVFRDNLLKIGKTKNPVKDRAKHLSSNTNMPSEFVVEFKRWFSDTEWAENEIFKRLRDYRVNDRREFFNCELDYAIRTIQEIAIIDLRDEIKILTEAIEENKRKSLTLTQRWTSFFDRLNWEYSVPDSNENGVLHPDIILKTKFWKEYPDENDDTQKIVFPKDSLIFVNKNLDDIISAITVIDSNYGDNINIFSVGKHPYEIKELYRSKWSKHSWQQVYFTIHHDKKTPKFGLLSEEMSWFCIIRGISLIKKNLTYNTDDEINEFWRGFQCHELN